MYGHGHRMGRPGRCICTKCGHTMPREPGLPCQPQKCPKCGARMMRGGSWHHQIVMAKKLERNDVFSDPKNP